MEKQEKDILDMTTEEQIHSLIKSLVENGYIEKVGTKNGINYYALTSEGEKSLTIKDTLLSRVSNVGYKIIKKKEFRK